VPEWRIPKPGTGRTPEPEDTKGVGGGRRRSSVEDELGRRSEGHRGHRLGEGWRRGCRDPRSEGWHSRRGAGVAGSERGGAAVGGIRGRKGGAVGGAPGSPARRGVAGAGGSAWVAVAWAGAAGAMGGNERIRAGAMGDAGAGAMGDAGAGGIGLLSTTA
jgi:hypothetical protein